MSAAPALKSAVRLGTIAGGSYLKKKDTDSTAKLLFNPRDGERKAAVRVHRDSKLNSMIIKLGTKLAGKPKVIEETLNLISEELSPEEQESFEAALRRSCEIGTIEDDKREKNLSLIKDLLEQTEEGLGRAEVLKDDIKACAESMDGAQALSVDDQNFMKVFMGNITKTISIDRVSDVSKALVQAVYRLIKSIWPGSESAVVSKENQVPMIYSMAVNVASLVITMSLLRRFVHGQTLQPDGEQIQRALALQHARDTLLNEPVKELD